MSLLHLIPIHHLSSPSPPLKPPKRPKKRRYRTVSVKATASSSARRVLDQIPHTDTFAWNALIRAHLADGEPTKAILVYIEMLMHGVQPDRHTVPRVIDATCLCGTFSSGRQLHGHALKLGLATNEYVVTALMTMYGRFDGADAAGKIFKVLSSGKTSVSWTQLAKLYLDVEKPDLALQVFWNMSESCADVDAVALATALKACGKLRSAREGRRVYKIARKLGLESDQLVGNTLLKMYAECGKMDNCREVFDRLPLKDAVSWTTVITAYVHNGEFNEAIKLFRAMCSGGDKPDSFAVTAILPACARMSACKNGKEIHGYVARNNLGLNPAVQNALIDMYVKAGCLELALNIFSRFSDKNAISWIIMILGLSLHGQGERGIELFRSLEKELNGASLDEPAYLAALHACNTACMVEKARSYFNRIRKPGNEAFALMVGVLVRAGLFPEACTFIDEHKIGTHIQVLKSLLDGCRIHRNLKLGKRVANQLIELEPLNPENYILLSNINAADGKWHEVERLKETIRDMGLSSRKAYSWIELRGKIHAFGVGDVSHPRSERIYWELRYLMNRISPEMRLPVDDFSLHEVDEERECIPSGHSEMLAIALGLISVPGSRAVQVTKNQRVCRNCHHLAKLISKISDREIILKDPNRFHHLKDGDCSCKDCW